MVGLGWPLVLLLCVGCGVAQEIENDVTIDPKAGVMIYDTQPKLRIKGSGFQGISGEIDLLMLVFDPPMPKGTTYSRMTVKSDDFLVLELSPGKRWAESEDRSRVRTLELKEASFRGQALITNRVAVAKVVPTPVVYPSTNMLYLTATPRLRINGTNFSEKSTTLYFSPPLENGVDVEIMVASPTTIWVSLVQRVSGAKWADEPGPLKLVGIDTGAGALVLRADLGGITIAEMQAGMKGHSISVQTHEEINMYQSTKVLTVAGEGLRADDFGGTTFRFGTSLNSGANFTVEVSDTSAVFTLTEGSKWRQNVDALPGPLVMLAANAGDGWVPLGATMAKAGRKVATVYEDPSVEPSRTVISRTHTHELIVKGTGFTQSFHPIFTFEPHMEREDYVVHVLNRTHAKVALATAQAGWLPEGENGLLSVLAINTGAGMFQLNESVLVAEVVPDDSHHSGIALFPSYDKQMYQTSSDPLIIEGKGFPVGESAELKFGFAGPDAKVTTCRILSDTQLEVKVAEGYTWASQGGPLFVTAFRLGEHEMTFKTPGVMVATVNDDPFVEASQLQVYASHTRHITIKGRGFVSSHNPYFMPKVVLSPTVWGSYTVKSGGWTSLSVTISLMPIDGSDVSKWADVRKEFDSVPIKVVSVDTGAGDVFMPGGGIVVASVRADDATFSCDDSCIYANDEQCDENQAGEDSGVSLKWSGYNTISNAGSSTSVNAQPSSGRGYAGGTSLMSTSDDLVFMEAPSCQIGTDCTDCGLQMVAPDKCTNTCKYARDGTCDDRRSAGVCADGTDCQDCGPWGEANFTEPDSPSIGSVDAYDDDDSGFLANDPDHPMLIGQRTNGVGRYKRVFAVHEPRRKDSENAEGVFLDVLWAIIVMVGFSVFVYATILMSRSIKGEPVHMSLPTNPDAGARI